MAYSFRDSVKSTRFGKKIKRIADWHLRYKNLILLVLSILFARRMLSSVSIFKYIDMLNSLGYASSFFIGILFSYGLTTAPAIATFIMLGRTLSPLVVTAIGALGAMVGDFIAFKFIKDDLVHELKLIKDELKVEVSMRKILKRHKYLTKIMPLIGGLIIALPLPTRLTTPLFAAMFALMKYDTKKFLLCAYVLNFVSIFLITYAGKFFFV